MKIVTWNVNGLRSVQRKNFSGWLNKEKPDVLCLQEVKLSPGNLDDGSVVHPPGYRSYWALAKRPGYSGLGVYTKHEPDDLRPAMGQAEFDDEGRWLELDFGPWTVVNSYFPNSQRDHARLSFKLEFCRAAESRLEKLKKKGRRVLLCGDFNIAHREIDLKNPKSNKDNAGFLPEERAWMDHMIDKRGWVDVFRHFEPGPGHYTWWSYRPGVREKNVGWRLDYFLTNQESLSSVAGVEICSDVMGSDHCPVRLALKVKGM